MTVNTACSSGADAIILGAMLLKTGEADSVLVLGGESGINPLMIGSLSKAMALSRRNDDPVGASRPFDRDRDGFVMGEGGGAVVLELESHAKARGAKIYAELAGYANTSDAYHVTAPNPTGEGAAQCMERAIAMSGLSKSEIGYINAHGSLYLCRRYCRNQCHQACVWCSGADASRQLYKGCYRPSYGCRRHHRSTDLCTCHPVWDAPPHFKPTHTGSGM